MSFSNIKGHDRVISFLKSSMSSGRIANAYIFRGKDGIGKRSVAVSFAKAINCLTAPGEGCDSCSSCRKIDHLNHPDVRVVVPEKDGASVKIDDIRSVIKDVGLKPYESKKKVYIIDEANSLTEEAAAALLKTLEEPSRDSTLILIAENSSQLLPTIRSRCQMVNFLPLDAVMVEEILTVAHKVEKSHAHVLAMISCGSIAAALKLSGEDFFDKREQVLRSLASGGFLDMEFDKTSKADLRSILNIMLTWYRDILVTKVANGGLINIDKEGNIRDEAKKISLERIDKVLKKIISTQAYLDINANPKLAMMALGISI